MRLLILASAALLISLAPARAATALSVCQTAALQAEKQFAIPAGMLQAISLVETGRYKKGETVAWPWTVNVAGKGHYFETRAAAETFVSQKKKKGAASIDIGCFQINTKWHGQAFETPLAMFEPEDGAAYAASFLSKLHGELGDWNAAVKSYHSRNARKGAAYGKKIAAALETLGHAAPRPALAVPAVAPIVTSAAPALRPALRDGPHLTATSANNANRGGVQLTLFAGGEPLIAPAAKPLFTRKE